MILVVVAHPDDESLFCGATIARHVSGGDDVHVVTMGTGVGARGETGEALVRAEVARRKAFQAACEILGAGWTFLRTFPDQKSDTVPQLEINRAVEKRIEAHKPDRVYTHHVGDLNIDHRRVAEAVLVAMRMGPPVRCMSPEFPDRCVGPAFEPTDFTTATRARDGAEFFKKKMRACLCYGMELRVWPHPRSERAIRERDEAFMEIR